MIIGCNTRHGIAEKKARKEISFEKMEVESIALVSNQHKNQGSKIQLASRICHIAASTIFSNIFLTTDSNVAEWIFTSYQLCLVAASTSLVCLCICFLETIECCRKGCCQ